MEYKLVYDLGVVLLCKYDGVVEFVDVKEICVCCDNGVLDKYMVIKFCCFNLGISYN